MHRNIHLTLATLRPLVADTLWIDSTCPLARPVLWRPTRWASLFPASPQVCRDYAMWHVSCALKTTNEMNYYIVTRQTQSGPQVGYALSLRSGKIVSFPNILCSEWRTMSTGLHRGRLPICVWNSYSSLRCQRVPAWCTRQPRWQTRPVQVSTTGCRQHIFDWFWELSACPWPVAAGQECYRFRTHPQNSQSWMAFANILRTKQFPVWNCLSSQPILAFCMKIRTGLVYALSLPKNCWVFSVLCRLGDQE